MDSTSAGAAVGPRCRLSAFASRSVAGALAIALGSALVPGAALAQPAPAQAPPATGSAQREPTPAEMEVAKRSFEDGVRFYNEGNYDAARAQFEAAYKLSRFPALLYNLGKTAEKQNQRRDAIRFLEQYLETKPQDAPEVEAKLQDLRKAEGLPLDGSQPVPPPTAPTAAAATPSPRWLVGTQKVPPIPSLALLGTGAAFLIVGIGCGAAALSAANEVQNSNGQPYAGNIASLQARGPALSSAAIAFDVLGGVALAGGGAWLGYWLYLRSKKPETLPTALRVIPSLGGIGVAGSF
ncbi:MAG: tetratricopeptide repeat protein [Polyangia bacterium]